jgi:hypothetical protein
MSEVSAQIPPVPTDTSYLKAGSDVDTTKKTLLLNAKTSVESQSMQVTSNYLAPHVDAAKAIGGQA